MVELCFYFFQLFNYLTTYQMEQMAHLGLLHANQAVVPAANPAPGFEHLMCHPPIKLLDQKLHTVEEPGKPAERGFNTCTETFHFRNCSCCLFRSQESKAENCRDVSCTEDFVCAMSFLQLSRLKSPSWVICMSLAETTWTLFLMVFQTTRFSATIKGNAKVQSLNFLLFLFSVLETQAR